MARVVVDVMFKPEILDPQGKAVHSALPRLGFEGVLDVRQGKRFELQLAGEVTPERLDQVAGARCRAGRLRCDRRGSDRGGRRCGGGPRSRLGATVL